MPSSTPAIENAGHAAWHSLFRTATPQALLAAVSTGLVPVPCLDTNGNDLLTTVLCRNLVEFGAPVHVFGMVVYQTNFPSQEQYRALLKLLDALLERADVEPFRFQDVSDARLSVSQSAPIDMALGWGLEGLAVETLKREGSPRGEALAVWNRALEGQVGAVGNRSQLAVALARNQAQVVHALIDAGLDVNEVDPMGYTPLFSAPSLLLLKKMLNAGARMDAHTVKVSPAEHWSKAMTKLSNDYRKELKEMVTFASDKFGASGALPVIFLQSEELRASTATGTDLPKTVREWSAKWETVCSKVPRSEDPLTWARTQTSGIWKGNISVVAQVGINLVEAAGCLQPALIDLKPWLSSERPHHVRRGVTDRGLFALGAFNLLANHRNFTSAQVIGVSVHQDHFVQKARESVLELLSLHSQEQWVGWMTEASVTIQRSNIAGSRQVVSDAWLNFFSFAKDPKNGWISPGPGGVSGGVLTLANEFLDKGGHLCGSSWLQFLTKEGQLGMRTSWSSARDRLAALERQPEFRYQWAQLLLSTFLSGLQQTGVQVYDTGNLGCPNYKVEAVISDAIKSLNEALQGVTAPISLLTHPQRQQSIVRALEFLGKLKEASPHVRSLVLASQLPSEAPMETPTAPKPRF